MSFWDDALELGAKIGLAPVTGGASFLVDPSDAEGIALDLWDPQRDERKRAEEQAARAGGAWDGIAPAVAETKGLGVGPDDLMYYGLGDPLEAYLIDDRSGMIQGDPLGRDMQLGAGQYFGDVAHSGYVDPNARGMQEGAAAYFANLAASGGVDAIANAEYERRKMEAEQDARSKRDAAMQQAEMTGAGNIAGLIADLQTGQSAATRSNMAGLQAAADQQARRDFAAGSASDIAAGLHGQSMEEAYRRDAAAGAYAGIGSDIWQHGFDQTQAQFDAWFGTEYANQGVETEVRGAEWNRANEVSDGNVDLHNAGLQSEDDAAQRYFNNLMGWTSGRSNAYLGHANVTGGFAQPQQPFFDRALQAGSNVAKVAGGG